MTKFFSLTALAVVGSISLLAHAKEVRRTGEMCIRGLTYDSALAEPRFKISAKDRKDLIDGKPVSKFLEQENGYKIGYIFSLADYDAELVMGVFSSCDQHAGSNGLGSFVEKSEYRTNGNRNPFQVYYEQAGKATYDNGQYTVEDTLRKIETADGTGYRLDTRLLDSSDRGMSPKWLDAYFQVSPHGRGSFVVACNYMVPRTSWFQGGFNDEAASRLRASGKNLLKWVSRVAGDNAQSQGYRARVKTLLGE